MKHFDPGALLINYELQFIKILMELHGVNYSEDLNYEKCCRLENDEIMTRMLCQCCLTFNKQHVKTKDIKFNIHVYY